MARPQGETTQLWTRQYAYVDPDHVCRVTTPAVSSTKGYAAHRSPETPHIKGGQGNGDVDEIQMTDPDLGDNVDTFLLG